MQIHWNDHNMCANARSSELIIRHRYLESCHIWVCVDTKMCSTSSKLNSSSYFLMSRCQYLAFLFQKYQNKQFHIFSTFRTSMESSDHGLSEYLYHDLVVSFILTQDREEVNPSHYFCARLGFLFSNKITRSWNFLTGGPGRMQTWLIMNDIDSL